MTLSFAFSKITEKSWQTRGWASQLSLFLVSIVAEDAEQIEEEADDYLIQSTTLNGNPWSDYRISHQQILQGGELHFEMKATK